MLLKKENDYPCAWKQHKAYLYTDGSLIFVDQKSDKGALDSGLLHVEKLVLVKMYLKMISSSYSEGESKNKRGVLEFMV